MSDESREEKIRKRLGHRDDLPNIVSKDITKRAKLCRVIGLCVGAVLFVVAIFIDWGRNPSLFEALSGVTTRSHGADVVHQYIVGWVFVIALTWGGWFWRFDVGFFFYQIIFSLAQLLRQLFKAI